MIKSFYFLHGLFVRKYISSYKPQNDMEEMRLKIENKDRVGEKNLFRQNFFHLNLTLLPHVHLFLKTQLKKFICPPIFKLFSPICHSTLQPQEITPFSSLASVRFPLRETAWHGVGGMDSQTQSPWVQIPALSFIGDMTFGTSLCASVSPSLKWR